MEKHKTPALFPAILHGLDAALLFVFTKRAYSESRKQKKERRNAMNELRNKRGFICDMDGVLYHGNRLLPSEGIFAVAAYAQ